MNAAIAFEKYLRCLETVMPVQAQGKVAQVVGLVVEATGPACRLGAVCDIHTPDTASPLAAEVLGFRGQRVLLMPLEEIRGISPGCRVVPRQQRATVAVGPGLLGRVVERAADIGVITNDNPRCEKPLAIVHDILDGYVRPARAHVLPDRAEAIRWALAQAQPDDAVLIAGKGDRCVQVVREQRLPFDDGAVARDWLREVRPALAAPAPAEPRLLPFRGGVGLIN